MGHPALVRPTEGLDGDPFIPPKVFTQWWADGEAMTGDVRLTKAWCPIQAVVWLEWDTTTLEWRDPHFQLITINARSHRFFQ